MTSFSKFKDIEAVMKKATSQLPIIEQEYQNCLQKEEIPEHLLVEIKNYLENLRSALDYLWHKMPAISGDFFPVANSEADFSAKTINIEERHRLILRNHQDYNSNSWIRCFNLFRNKNVHLTLVPQKRKETREFSVRGSSGSITSRGCSFHGNITFGVNGARVPIDERTQFPADVAGVDIERIIWVDFVFDGSSISSEFPQGVSALAFLKESLDNVSQIIQDIEQEL